MSSTCRNDGSSRTAELNMTGNLVNSREAPYFDNWKRGINSTQHRQRRTEDMT